MLPLPSSQNYFYGDNFLFFALKRGFESIKHTLENYRRWGRGGRKEDVGIGSGTKSDGEKLRLLSLLLVPWSPHSHQRRHRTIIADGHPMESDTFFRVNWNCGKITLQCPNGRFLGIASNGLLMANVTIPGEPSHSPPSLTHIAYHF